MLSKLLQKAWDSLDKNDTTSLHSWKLEVDRLENVVWSPPILKFQIERHGGTALGSIYADIHAWEVNIDTRQANFRYY